MQWVWPTNHYDEPVIDNHQSEQGHWKEEREKEGKGTRRGREAEVEEQKNRRREAGRKEKVTHGGMESR